MSERVAANLRWYFREADGAMGIRSNFESMVARLNGRGTVSIIAPDLDQRHVAAAARARRIQAVLELLSLGTRRTLEHAYRTGSGAVNLAAVMLTLPRAADEHRRSRTKRVFADWVSRLETSAQRGGDPGRRRLFASLKQEAERVLAVALEAYQHEERKQQRQGRGSEWHVEARNE